MGITIVNPNFAASGGEVIAPVQFNEPTSFKGNGSVPAPPAAGIYTAYVDPVTGALLLMRNGGVINPLESAEQHIPFFASVTPVVI